MFSDRTNPPRILLTGITGQLGWELFRVLSTLGEVVAASRTGESPLPGVTAIALDFSNPGSLGEQVREIHPGLIVNAAAYTAVDRAESEASLAMTVNAAAPGALAREAKGLGALLIHFSTDYVFDGLAGSPYGEDDTPRPLNQYGKTKLAGEQAIQASGADHLIFRTGWVYGGRGNNFLRTMLRLFTERDSLTIVDDQWGVPNWCAMLARAVGEILAGGEENGFQKLRAVSGLYHISAEGKTNWHGFARAIQACLPPEHAPQCRLLPIDSSRYPQAAQRPMETVLDTGKAERVLGVRLPSWQEMLQVFWRKEGPALMDEFGMRKG
ncbi:MAG: dTDP-4-dehydrorhamnose reductase [bacterium]